MNGRREILVKRAPGVRRSAPLAEIEHLQDANAVECDGDDITRTNRLARRIDAATVDAHLAAIGERRRRAARAHHARVPQPFVDALPIQPLCGVNAAPLNPLRAAL